MRKLLKWFAELWKKIEKYLSKSRTFFSITFLIIGVSYTIASYEFYFREHSLWKDYKEAIREFDDYMKNKNKYIVEPDRELVSSSSEEVAKAQVKIADNLISEKSNYNKVGVKTPTPVIGINDIVSKVHILESSGGKNDGCKRYGKVNGYGYRQNSKEWICFETKKEVEKYVADLFEERLKVMSLEESLCMYNIGIKTNDCEYVNNFYKLT